MKTDRFTGKREFPARSRACRARRQACNDLYNRFRPEASGYA